MATVGKILRGTQISRAMSVANQRFSFRSSASGFLSRITSSFSSSPYPQSLPNSPAILQCFGLPSPPKRLPMSGFGCSPSPSHFALGQSNITRAYFASQPEGKIYTWQFRITSRVVFYIRYPQHRRVLLAPILLDRFIIHLLTRVPKGPTGCPPFNPRLLTFYDRTTFRHTWICLMDPVETEEFWRTIFNHHATHQSLLNQREICDTLHLFYGCYNQRLAQLFNCLTEKHCFATRFIHGRYWTYVCSSEVEAALTAEFGKDTYQIVKHRDKYGYYYIFEMIFYHSDELLLCISNKDTHHGGKPDGYMIPHFSTA